MGRSSMLMKAKKVAAIVGHENPALSHRERQDLGIRHGRIRLSGAYDPYLSCSTHADGTPALEIALKCPGGEVLDRLG